MAGGVGGATKDTTASAATTPLLLFASLSSIPPPNRAKPGSPRTHAPALPPTPPPARGHGRQASPLPSVKIKLKIGIISTDSRALRLISVSSASPHPASQAQPVSPHCHCSLSLHNHFSPAPFARFASPVLVSTSPALAPRTLVACFFSFQTLFRIPFVSFCLPCSPSSVDRSLDFASSSLFSLGYISPRSESNARVTVISSVAGRIKTTSAPTLPPLDAGLATSLEDCASCTLTFPSPFEF